MRARTDKWNWIQLKTSFTAKETMARIKRQSIKWGKISAGYSSQKALISKIYKKLKN
jgi:hypothetical protein